MNQHPGRFYLPPVQMGEIEPGSIKGVRQCKRCLRLSIGLLRRRGRGSSSQHRVDDHQELAHGGGERKLPGFAGREQALVEGANDAKRGLDSLRLGSFRHGAEERKMASIRPGGATNVPDLSCRAICAMFPWHAGHGSCSEFTSGSFGENASCVKFPCFQGLAPD